MNPRLEMPPFPDYFRKNSKKFKSGEYIYVFEAVQGDYHGIGRIKKANPKFFKRWEYLTTMPDLEYIKGFGLNKVRKTEMIYYIIPNKIYNTMEPFVLYVRRNGRLIDPEEMISTTRNLNLSHMPILYEGKYNPEYVVNLCHGPSRLHGDQRSGCIIMNDIGLSSFLPNMYLHRNSGFKSWIRQGGYR